jgi:hypothetical protein
MDQPELQTSPEVLPVETSGTNSFTQSKKFKVIALVTTTFLVGLLLLVLAFGQRQTEQPPVSTPVSYAQCVLNGVTYEHGEGFDNDCNTCVCDDGAAVCTDMACEIKDDKPVVTTVSDNGSNVATSYSSSNQLKCSWSATNAQSFTVNVGSTPGGNDIRTQTVAASENELVTTLNYLPKVGVYYCSVQAHKDSVNSDLKSSDGIFMDLGTVQNLRFRSIGNILKENCTAVEGLLQNVLPEQVELKVWVSREVNGVTQYSHEPDGGDWSTEFRSYTSTLRQSGSGGSTECDTIFTYQRDDYDTATGYAQLISKETGKILGETSLPVLNGSYGGGLAYPDAE